MSVPDRGRGVQFVHFVRVRFGWGGMRTEEAAVAARCEALPFTCRKCGVIPIGLIVPCCITGIVPLGVACPGRRGAKKYNTLYRG